MLKLVYCIRRRSDISPETFYRYWLQDHAPKVAGVAESNWGRALCAEPHLPAGNER